MVIQITPINLIPGQMIPRVNISQYDTGARVLKFSVYNGEAPFTFTNAMTVALVGTKPDGKGFSYAGTIVSNMPTFDVTAQMSAVAGKVRSELVVFENGKRVGSGNFVIFVEECALGEGTDMSDSDYAIINDALEAAFDLDHFYADLQSMVTEAVEDIQVVQGQTVIDPTLTISGAAADAKATGDMARNFLEALMSETTTEAGIATIDDGAGGLPLKQFVGNIQPAQAGSGDPSPDNVRAIIGYDSLTVSRSAKNLIPYPYSVGEQTVAGVAFTYGTDGSVMAVGTPTQNLYKALHGGFANNKVPVPSYMKKGASYTISSGIDNPTAGNHFEVVFYDAEGTSTVYRDGSFTVPESAVYYGLFIRILQNFGAVNETFYPMIRLASDTDETFEPYNGATYPVTFPTSAGTVYGGTLVVNSDGSGTLTVDRAGFDANTKTWAWGGGMYVYTNLSATALLSGYPTVQSSHFPFRAQGGTADGYCSWGGSPNSNGNLVVRSEAVAPNLEAWRTYIAENTVTFVYPLATPQTYALSAVQVAQMLQGVNNVWMDANGTVQATYYANTALYVSKQIAEMQAMVLENQ